MKNRIACFVLSFVFVFGFSHLLTVSSDTEEEQASYEVNLSEFGENSYHSYMAKYADADFAQENIEVDLSGKTLDSDPVAFEANIPAAGLYGIGMTYRAEERVMGDIRVGLMIDGEYPYQDAEKLEFARMWCDDKSAGNTDAMGNEYVPGQVLFGEEYYNVAIDDAVQYDDWYYVYLSEGVHSVSLVPVKGKAKLKSFTFCAAADPEKYQAPKSKSNFYTGDPIVIEGESAAIKSNYFLIGKSDTSSTMVTPQSAKKRLINYIGGNWSRVGDTLIWETPELEAGYYSLGYVFRQNTVIGSKSYRTLRIDGEIPFKEAKVIGFSYGDNWQNGIFAEDDGDPYCFYLKAGTHRISMAVTSGEMTGIRQMLTKSVSLMGDLYIDITKITGETVDINRDYNLFGQIGNMEKRLKEIRGILSDAGKQMLEVTGERSGSNYSVINNMIEVIDKMLDNKFEAHRYKNYYYTNFCAVSSVLQDLRSMPLDLDKLILFAPEDNKIFEDIGFFAKIKFSVTRFLVSFSNDYNTISSSDDENTIDVWVNWGRDQAQVLSSLVQRSFTPQTGISVNIKLVNASVIQAVLSGKGPDCLLRHARSEPVNLAMRGVLYDLTEFGDYKEVLERFMPGADTPYWYKDGLYALPDSQSFFMLFYRKDVLAKYGIKVPTTWDEFDLAAKLLMRNNMSVYLPSTAVTDVAQANAGVGSNNIFPSLLLQNGIKLYEPDGKKTNLLTADTMKVFEKWTNYYTKYKFPKTIDFYNRFRTGTTPLGISAYNFYTTLKVAAPELDGLWSFTAIPGTVREDGTVSRISAGSGTACSIMKMSKKPELAWEFLKWWTDTETQLNYSNDLETLLGPTGRVTLSNVEAIKALDWEDDSLQELLQAWGEVEEIPEYPGSYYVSRSIYQAYWNVINTSKSAKDMMMLYGTEADDEIARKWEQYTNR